MELLAGLQGGRHSMRGDSDPPPHCPDKEGRHRVGVRRVQGLGRAEVSTEPSHRCHHCCHKNKE